MRTWTTALAMVLALSAPAAAQHDPFKALNDSQKAVDDAVSLQRRLQQQLLGDTADVNATVSSLRRQRQDLADRTAIVNNVISFRKKDDLARWVEEAKQKWGAESGPRIRLFNPYDMSSYARYYDERGNLMVTEVRNSYEYLRQSR